MVSSPHLATDSDGSGSEPPEVTRIEELAESWPGWRIWRAAGGHGSWMATRRVLLVQSDGLRANTLMEDTSEKLVNQLEIQADLPAQ